MNYTCHSGGCPGADMMWENEGDKYDVTTISYSFRNHIQEGKNQKILTVDELSEGWTHVKVADRTLRKNVGGLDSPYVRNLLCRNWFQVKNASAVFAIGKLFDKTTVDGGTGWAVQMAIDSDKPVYVYNQETSPMRPGNWYRWMALHFERIDYIPILTENFAGIGTRNLSEDGQEAIRKIYYASICKSQ